MTTALGIDFGGTKILAGVIDTDNGKIIAKAKKRTRSEHGSEDVISRLLSATEEALTDKDVDREQVTALGIGVAGQVDSETGELIRAPNLPDELLGDTITEQLRKHFDLPVYLYNDLAIAAAGEAAFGSGRDEPDFVCIFVGTGIGGAIYRNGEPYRGATNTAGEIGHTVVDFNGRFCGCGGRGHLEAYASRTAMVREILAAMILGRESSLSEVDPNPDPTNPGDSPIRSKALAHAVEQGDALANEAIENAARYLGAGLVSVINFYNPPLIILGGGAVGAIDRFFDLAVQHATEEALLVPRKDVRIVRAKLEDYSGIVGAAVLAARAQAAS